MRRTRAGIQYDPDQSQVGGTQWNELMAASVLVILPVLVLLFLAQKTFVQGISTTGLTG